MISGLVGALACKSVTQDLVQADVVIVGGGTGGTAAAIQSARSGSRTILVSETPWLGGMLTAAGVSCTDGNHLLPSGIWNEFREAVYAHYGTRNLATGWVSNFNFEPHVGDSVFKSWVAALPNLTILYRHRLLSVKTAKDGNGKKIESVRVLDENTGKAQTLRAKVFVDATELGDLFAEAGAGFDVGLEPEDVSGEKGFGVDGSYGVIQDLTYAAVLKDYGPGADRTIPKPSGYDPMEFSCSSSDDCHDTTKLYSKVDARKMLDYGRLPNNKFMINWPSNGNDFYTDIIGRSYEERQKALDSARQKTLRFVYYIQTRLGMKHIGLADDEFDTPDGLPWMPYHREGRRVHGLVRFRSSDILQTGKGSNLYRTGISVGDYPIDHHHRMYPGPQPDLTFVPVPSYAIPAGVMIPKGFSNLVVCDKGISVTNIINGTTRLQPVVLLTGQAAGTLASLAASSGVAVSEVPVRRLQQALLDRKAYLLPYADVTPDQPGWMAVQRIGATGLLKGEGQAQGWANRTWFHPDKPLDPQELAAGLREYGREDLAKSVGDLKGSPTAAQLGGILGMETGRISGVLGTDKIASLNRRQAAILLDAALPLFDKAVDWEGVYR